jgi:hypothetical protein
MVRSTITWKVRTNCTITLSDSEGDVLSWIVYDVWPSSVDVTPFCTDPYDPCDGALKQTVILIHEKVELNSEILL